MVIGGQAVLQYGEPRLTRDIDVTLGVDTDRIAEILQLSDDLQLEPLVDPTEFTLRTMVLPCSAAGGLRVDFIFSFSDYEQQAIERSRRIVVAESPVRFASPEDLIVLKLVAGRPRDIEDVRAIVLKQSALDRELIASLLTAFERSLERPLRATWDALLRDLRRP
jgi:predicted nucleotidyltransferase